MRVAYVSPMSERSHILALDTSGPRLQLALTDGVKTDAVVEELPKGHAEIIFDRIAALLARSDCTYHDLSRIAVTTGPGSFTGLRIGLSAARGLGLGLAIPVIGVPTLVAMSLAVSRQEPFTIVVDARRDQAYAQEFTAPAMAVAKAKIISFDGNAAASHIMPEKVDIAALAHFAASVDPEQYPPNPVYIRDADAKPQTKGIVAHKVHLP